MTNKEYNAKMADDESKGITNDQFQSMVEESIAALVDAQRLHKSNLTIWAEQKGPYKPGKTIDAPFSVKVNHTHLYNAKLKVISVTATDHPSLGWVWEMKGSEGKDVYTWHEPMENNDS